MEGLILSSHLAARLSTWGGGGGGGLCQDMGATVTTAIAGTTGQDGALTGSTLALLAARQSEQEKRSPRLQNASPIGQRRQPTARPVGTSPRSNL